jgi:hypothetical protein
MTTPPGKRFEVCKRDFARTRWIETGVPDVQALAPGQALLAIDRFGLTSNNITYAIYGDSVGYWRFFPTSPGWGIIPVWGYADVVASRCEGVAVGERLFGLLPMASHLLIAPDRRTPTALTDSSPHRAALPPTYNEYRRTAVDPRHATSFEPGQMILKPLLMLSWLVADMFAEHSAFGAEQIVVTAASSRTGLGLAAALQHSMPDTRVVGLTFNYDSVRDFPVVGTTIADIAGNHAVLRALHSHFGASLKYSCRIGDTHQSGGPATALPGPAPVTFFAPDRILQRRAEWGLVGFHQRHAMAWDDLATWMQSRISIQEGSGQQAIADAYQRIVRGDINPRIAETFHFGDSHYIG